jgi:hypothetical protein
MENTPTVCGSDLPTVLRILKNDLTSRSVCVCVCVCVYVFLFTSQSSAQERVLDLNLSDTSGKEKD